MTAYSELFVDETVRDAVREELSKRHTSKYEGIQIAIPEEWYDIWDEGDFPDKGEAKILDETNKAIGSVQWKTAFNIDFDGMHRRIVAEPTELVIKLNSEV